MTKEYEVIIIGGGPAGLTAGLYTSRDRLNSLLIERGLVGGQIVDAQWVENYPGFPEGISGFELGQLIHQQATKYGLETVTAETTGVELQQEQKVVKTTKGAAFFRQQPVAIVGGGDAAITEALHLAKFASRVIVIHRRHQLRASRILREKALAEPKIEFLWDTVVEEIVGKDKVKKLKLHQVVTGEKPTLEIAGIFISIGLKPNTDYLKDILPLDATGHIGTNEKMETEIAGIFAAGDIRLHSARQAIAAAGDGATAAIYAEKFITGQT